MKLKRMFRKAAAMLLAIVTAFSVMFAADSHSELGKIQTASQGQFSIEDRDQYTPNIKTVRVVTYITYYLED